jgi:hypothetical protein
MSTAVPLIFVHIGDAVPDYARIAVQQARRWNPETPIYFLSNAIPEQKYMVGEIWVDISGIPVSPIHAKFNESTILDKNFREGFWRYTTERLFVLYDWLVSTGTKEFIHLEYDNMMYFSIEHLLPYFRENCKGISAPFHGQVKGQPNMCFSIIYSNDIESFSEFVFTLAAAPSSTNEMQRGGEYWLESEHSLLPCLPPESALKSEAFRAWYENPAFPYLFDAAAHGQYLGGKDPRNEGPPGPYINPDVDYHVGQFRYKWQVAESGNRYPVLIHKGREWPIANLHIHSKALKEFT